MHKVVDSNQLQDESFRRFLQEAKHHRAVVIDFLAIEGYSGDARGDFRWLEILAEFPKQLVFLKSSDKVMKLSGRPSGLLRRLVDERVSEGFSSHLAVVSDARRGIPYALSQVAENKRQAVEHLSKMEQEAIAIMPAMETLGRMYSKEERAIIRESGSYTRTMLDKLTANLFHIAVNMVGSGAHTRSFDGDIKNTLAFRTALAMYVLTLQRTADGGVGNMNPRGLRNDMVDMMFVAYGTFFDGVLTADARLSNIYDEVCILLFGLYDAFIADGLDPFGGRIPQLV